MIERRARTGTAERQALKLVVRADDGARIADLDIPDAAAAVGRGRAAVQRRAGPLDDILAGRVAARDRIVAVRDRCAAGQDDAAPQALRFVGDAAGQIGLRGEDDRLSLGALGDQLRAAVDDHIVVIGVGGVRVDQRAGSDRQRRGDAARRGAGATDVDTDIDAAIDFIRDARDLRQAERGGDQRRQAARTVIAEHADVGGAGRARRGGRTRGRRRRRRNWRGRRRRTRNDDHALARRGDTVSAIAGRECEAGSARQQNDARALEDGHSRDSRSKSLI